MHDVIHDAWQFHFIRGSVASGERPVQVSGARLAGGVDAMAHRTNAVKSDVAIILF